MIIILIGYMASGKSIIGKVLAKKLNYNFIDLDNYIETQESKTISDIFNLSGEIYFRKIEAKCLEKILSTNANIVLSLGGGTPCYGNNIDLIKKEEKAITFFLKTSINTIASRLKNEKAKRPLVARFNSKGELEEFIGKHLFERNQFYIQANYMINTDDVEIDDIVEDIVLKLF